MALMKLTTTDTFKILEKHRRWLDGDGGERADLTESDLARVDLTESDLAGANLTRAYLAGANFINANLAGANLTNAYLTGANFTNANFTGAYLTNAYLTGANFTGANFTGADLTGAYLACTRGVIDGGQDHRRYRFVAVKWQDGWHVFAGCRHWDSFDQALEHYKGAGGRRGVECPARIALLKTVAESLA